MVFPEYSGIILNVVSFWLGVGVFICVVADVYLNVVQLVSVVGDTHLRRGSLAPLVVGLSVCNLLVIITLFTRNVLFNIIAFGNRTESIVNTFQVMQYLFGLFYGASIFALVAVSIEQYCAVVHPFSIQTRRGTSLQQGLTRLAIVLAVAAVVAIPLEVLLALDIKRQVNDAEVVGTGMNTKTGAIYRLFVYCLIPLLLMAIFYGLTIHKLLLQDPSLNGPRVNTRKAAAKKVVTLTIVVFICLLPSEVVTTVSAFGRVPGADLHYMLTILALIMFYLNGLLAPVLLCLMSEKHRTRFLHVFSRSCIYCCCCCKGCCCCCWGRRKTGRVIRLRDEQQSITVAATGSTQMESTH